MMTAMGNQRLLLLKVDQIPVKGAAVLSSLSLLLLRVCVAAGDELLLVAEIVGAELLKEDELVDVADEEEEEKEVLVKVTAVL